MNAKFAVSILLFVFVHAIGRAQIDPRDPLGSAFRISQRSMVRAKLPARACAVFFSGGFFELFVWALAVLGWRVVAPGTLASRAFFVVAAVITPSADPPGHTGCRRR